MRPQVIGSFGEKDYIKAMRRASRQEEIERHGRQLEGRSMKYASRKSYSRKSKYPFAFNEDY